MLLLDWLYSLCTYVNAEFQTGIKSFIHRKCGEEVLSFDYKGLENSE